MNEKKNVPTRNHDRMHDLGFKMMNYTFKVMDFFRKPDGIMDKFGIQPGQTVVDYGCGPGRYVAKASRLVGPTGKVFAVDVHELAIEAVEAKLKKFGLKNVYPVLAMDGPEKIPDFSADLVYALDMFHMVSYPTALLQELKRMAKPGGRLILEDGHQPRERSREKVIASGAWNIVEENKRYMLCVRF